jgi:hypothetical protein
LGPTDFDNNSRLITLTGIVISGLHCNSCGAGETVRRSLCLDALRLEGGTRLGEVLPVILGLADNTSIQLLDLGSQRLILEDGPTQLVCQSLAKNSSLRLLSLEGWTFRIEVSCLMFADGNVISQTASDILFTS